MAAHTHTQYIAHMWQTTRSRTGDLSTLREVPTRCSASRTMQRVHIPVHGFSQL